MLYTDQVVKLIGKCYVILFDPKCLQKWNSLKNISADLKETLISVLSFMVVC